MLTEERYSVILDLLDQKGSITVTELVETLGISESTARRDLGALDKAGRLTKVFGGAVSLVKSSFINEEPTVSEKKMINVEEKKRIARYAASLIEKDDFVYLDAGTTTEYLIDYLEEKKVTFVTNAVPHAQHLSEAGYQVMVIGGILRGETHAIVGAMAIECMKDMYFSKGFFGTNGITKKAGFTTPDSSEALVKKTAFEHSDKVFVLADHDKFEKMSRMSFGEFDAATILTDSKPGKEYDGAANVKVVP